jgi:hypothetical protein
MKGKSVCKAGELNLKGKWFHSFKDGGLCWQGQILSHNTRNDLCLVQLYEWVLGDSSVQRLVPLTDMVGWQFYDTDEEMRFYSKREEAKSMQNW